MTQSTTGRIRKAVLRVSSGEGRKRYPSPLKAEHLTPAERVARGKAARGEVPRSSHSVFEPSPIRRDPVELLETQAVTRVPELVPIRYGRMLSSSFAFYRGGALVMAADLAGTPVSGLHVQACGDAHLSNFGVFASPERRLVFDINDFDETLPGPWEWDVKRLAASFSIAARTNGYTDAERRSIVMGTVGAYRAAMAQLAGEANLGVWYQSASADRVLDEVRKAGKTVRAKLIGEQLDKAKTRDNMQVFSKLITLVDGEPRFLSTPPLLVPVEELLPELEAADLNAAIAKAIRGYRSTLTTDRRHLLESYRYVHLARKVVGVGSVGTRAWVALFLGRDGDDPLFLQVKEAQASVLEDFVGRSQFVNAGQRVVAGQRLMQSSSDIFLGWQRITGPDGVRRDFYFRQLRDWKGSVEVEQMLPGGMLLYGRLCGWTLARAHARSGDRIAISSYLGAGDVFDRAIFSFAESYADQNDRDHAVLVEAVKSGRVKAESGV